MQHLLCQPEPRCGDPYDRRFQMNVPYLFQHFHVPRFGKLPHGRIMKKELSALAVKAVDETFHIHEIHIFRIV